MSFTKLFRFNQIKMVNLVPRQLSGGHGVKPMTMPIKNEHKIKERVLFTLQLNEKVDAKKLSIDSHFFDQLGLSQTEHAEVIDSVEEEFEVEIPDNDAVRLVRPIDIVKYVVDVINIRSQFDESHEAWRKRISMAYY